MRKERLTKTSQFAAVYEGGKSRADSFLVLKAIPNGLDVTRCGFTVSKRIGNAVVRNRVKRRLRVCLQQMSVEEGWDIVFIARAGISIADYRTIQKSVQGLLKRGHLLMDGQKV